MKLVSSDRERKMMKHMETARVNEMLGLQVGVIRQAAAQLDINNLELLEADLDVLEEAVKKLREMLAGLPHLA